MNTNEVKIKCFEMCKGNQWILQREMLQAATTQEVLSITEENREPGFDSDLSHTLAIL